MSIKTSEDKVYIENRAACRVIKFQMTFDNEMIAVIPSTEITATALDKPELAQLIAALQAMHDKMGE